MNWGFRNNRKREGLYRIGIEKFEEGFEGDGREFQDFLDRGDFGVFAAEGLAIFCRVLRIPLKPGGKIFVSYRYAEDEFVGEDFGVVVVGENKGDVEGRRRILVLVLVLRAVEGFGEVAMESGRDRSGWNCGSAGENGSVSAFDNERL